MSMHRVGGRKRGAVRTAVKIESLENRQLLAATASLSASIFYFNDVYASASTGGSGASPTQNLTIKNTGKAVLNVTNIAIGGNASEFKIVNNAALAISPGQSKTIGLKFEAKNLGVRTAVLNFKTNDSTKLTNSLKLRGLGTAGTGGNTEPSFQRVLDLFQIPVKVGDDNPADTNFPTPPKTPNDEVSMQTLKKAGSGNVTIELLGTFLNFKSPATAVGWYKPAGAKTQLFTVPQADAQRVKPKTEGSRSFDPGSSSFGIFTTFPAFTGRAAYSEDSLNGWDSVNKRKIRFYPLKNADGSKVSNAYVFATEDYNKAYDSNDVIGIIRNVKAGSTSTSGGGTSTDTSTATVTPSTGNISGLEYGNFAGLPAEDVVVFNRIENPDEIRPNVTRDKSTIQLKNNSGSPITIDSIELGDSSAFNIVSGGGSNFTIDPGGTRNLVLQFVGKGTGTTIVKTFSVPLKIKSGGNTDTVALNALWQAYSEQTLSKKYCEPSLQVIVNNVFGFKTTILNPGESTNHKGQPVAVGEEVQSAYWERADSNEPVKVRMLAAFHRQNNFDKVTGEPISAESNLFFYYKGNKDGHTRLIQHNVDEGQCLLPHKKGSTSSWAEASFSPTSGKTFGFEVDKHFTDRSLNQLDYNPTTLEEYPGSGYAFRIFPLRDTRGNRVENAYIVAGDNTANPYANWDYNDNIYVVYNIKPADSGSRKAMSVAASSPFATDQEITSPDVFDASPDVALV